MSQNKLSFTIGISAFNEGGNIVQLLKDIALQNFNGFHLDKILIISDGSTDETVNLVKKIKYNKIEIINDKKRLGKPARINQIFDLSKSDAVIILDADIRLASKTALANLLMPLVKNKKVQLTSGIGNVYAPKNFIQRVASVGIKIWYDCRSQKNVSEMYWCDGSMRAFGKKLYKIITFPQASADEAFSYLFCIKNGYLFQCVKEAIFHNILPSTLKDYINQTKRFIKSPSIQKVNFDPTLVNENFNINHSLKLKIFSQYLLKMPSHTFSYVCVALFARLANMIDQTDSPTWTIISSTKRHVRGPLSVAITLGALLN